MSVYFVHLAGGASFDIICNKVPHVWPPVVGLNKAKSF